jgi:hypothetical protein
MKISSGLDIVIVAALLTGMLVWPEAIVLQGIRNGYTVFVIGVSLLTIIAVACVGAPERTMFRKSPADPPVAVYVMWLIAAIVAHWHDHPYTAAAILIQESSTAIVVIYRREKAEGRQP